MRNQDGSSVEHAVRLSLWSIIAHFLAVRFVKRSHREGLDESEEATCSGSESGAWRRGASEAA